jgi:beta-lactamase regulating signal transducer with metallopeptidase domain
LQMFGLMYVAVVAMTIQPRAAVAEAISVVWLVLALICWVSTAKELFAIRDRSRIKPEATQ